MTGLESGAIVARGANPCMAVSAGPMQMLLCSIHAFSMDHLDGVSADLQGRRRPIQIPWCFGGVQ
ncbi:hypothetical protein CCO03_14450 [Comamonas serinivorans]|uniref:Uncharacterized protein n=1 Tax=Comamonas serinivorans TaxID=1082851 RepID=A0A1Y0EPZ2_9BURK|nr:hypothetical protein CCO03_14450 [Comamonas serinivorans]